MAILLNWDQICSKGRWSLLWEISRDSSFYYFISGRTGACSYRKSDCRIGKNYHEELIRTFNNKLHV